MRSDELIERQLEDWLEDEARQMPQHVLENALESVARTPQTSARGGVERWLRNGPVGILAAAAVVLLLVVAGGLAVDRIGSLFPTGSASAAPRQVWDPVADFRFAPNQLNPSPDSYGNPDVWSYLRSTTAEHEPQAYILFPRFNGTAWEERGLANLFVSLGGPDQPITMHPWSDGTTRKNAIIGWTSPIDGQVSISGHVSRAQTSCDVSTGLIVFTVDQGSETLRTVRLRLGQGADFTATATVTQGEFLYFVVDADADARCDLTNLTLQVTSE